MCKKNDVFQLPDQHTKEIFDHNTWSRKLFFFSFQQPSNGLVSPLYLISRQLEKQESIAKRESQTIHPTTVPTTVLSPFGSAIYRSILQANVDKNSVFGANYPPLWRLSEQWASLLSWKSNSSNQDAIRQSNGQSLSISPALSSVRRSERLCEKRRVKQPEASAQLPPSSLHVLWSLDDQI